MWRLFGIALMCIPASAIAKDVKFSMYYQAPETSGEWVLMFGVEKMSGYKPSIAELPAIESEAEEMAYKYCMVSPKWYDNTIVRGGLMDGTTSLAKYVKAPLSKKQPDKIKVVFFTGEEEVIECEPPEPKKKCEEGKVCLW